jgi:hypothetical protein
VRRVGIDYHVDVEGHFYSVPYRFARSEVEVRLTGRTVEIFIKGERIAVHIRSSGNGNRATSTDLGADAGLQSASFGRVRWLTINGPRRRKRSDKRKAPTINPPKYCGARRPFGQPPDQAHGIIWGQPLATLRRHAPVCGLRKRALRRGADRARFISGASAALYQTARSVSTRFLTPPSHHCFETTFLRRRSPR